MIGVREHRPLGANVVSRCEAGPSGQNRASVPRGPLLHQRTASKEDTVVQRRPVDAPTDSLMAPLFGMRPG
eukprot:7333320-Alexandrium_andersonii.AAC.2